MANLEIVLGLLFRQMDWLNLNSFKDRKIIQKTVYILQEMGIGPYFNFSWYLHGPYSPSLTECAYTINNNRPFYMEECDKYKFKDESQAVINNYKEMFSETKKNEEWLELVASLLYLKKNYNLVGDQLVEKLMESKPKYIHKDKLVKKALALIEQHFN